VGLAAAAFFLPAAAGASSTAASSAAWGPCAGHISVWYGLPSTGNLAVTVFQFQVSNTGSRGCTFFTYPKVSALTRHGTAAGLPATHRGRKVHVRIAPRGTAHFILVIENAPPCLRTHAVLADGLKIFVFGEGRASSVRLITHQCTNKSIMSVDAIHPGAGIPGFSTS